MLKSKKSKQGYTLLEVLVAGTLGMLLMGAITVFFVYLRRSFFEQTQVNTMQIETRTAFDLLVRDIRMSGYGLTADEALDANWVTWISGFTQNPLITQGSGTAGDVQCIHHFDPAVATFNVDVAAGTQTFSYNSTGGSANFDTGSHKLICIGGTETARITGLSNGTGGGTMTISTKANSTKGLKYSYPAGTTIDLIKTITYSLSDTAGEIYLKREDSTQTYSADWEAAMASNIEDFQIERSNDVYTVTLVGRTERAIPNASGDGFKRYTLNTTVKPKNQ